jgi:hypothetical protein
MTQSGAPKSQDHSANHAEDAQNTPPPADRPTSEVESPPPPPEHNNGGNHSNHAPWWRDKHFIVQLAIFVVTIVIAGIYKGQLKEMVESNRINSESLQSVQRGLVTFGGLQTGVRLVGPDKKTWLGNEIAVAWVNSGNTPAKSMVIRGNVQAWRSDLPEGFGFPEDKVNSPAVIGPKSNYGINVRVSKTDLLDTWNGNSRIFFWGSVLYKDAFKGDPDRLSEFCAEMTHVTLVATPVPVQPVPGKPTPIAPSIGEADTLAGFQWQACREHNCYDEDCKDYSSKVKIMRE